MNRLDEAAKLRERANELEREHHRPLPLKWEVGQKVRFIRDQEHVCSKGTIAVITGLRDEYRGTKASDYQVFYTRPIGFSSGKYWTTPDDVELVDGEVSP
ncbi:MAG: hypothetical protein JKY52_14385 [Flavobacteriales bacterium]|nr:hypothetical protein [Flavobacteriales bacterium]